MREQRKAEKRKRRYISEHRWDTKSKKERKGQKNQEWHMEPPVILRHSPSRGRGMHTENQKGKRKDSIMERKPTGYEWDAAQQRDPFSVTHHNVGVTASHDSLLLLVPEDVVRQLHDVGNLAVDDDGAARLHVAISHWQDLHLGYCAREREKKKNGQCLGTAIRRTILLIDRLYWAGMREIKKRKGSVWKKEKENEESYL